MPEVSFEKPDFSDWLETPEYRGDKLAEALEWNLAQKIDVDLDNLDWDKFDDDLDEFNVDLSPFDIDVSDFDKRVDLYPYEIDLSPLDFDLSEYDFDLTVDYPDTSELEPEDLDFPDWLYDILSRQPELPEIEDVTVRQYGGSGAFDAFMESFHNHLQVEYDLGRITGAEYATTWTQLVSIAIQQACSFVIERARLRWDLIKVAVDCWIAVLNFKMSLWQFKLSVYQFKLTIIETQLKVFQLRLAQIDSKNKLKFQCVSTKLADEIKLAEDKISTKVQLITVQLNTEVDLAKAKVNAEVQLATALVSAKTSLLTAKFNALISYWSTKSSVYLTRAQYCLTKLQLATEDAKYAYTLENMESARAQTMDTRLSDGETVVGYIGKQKDVYTQQIASFKRKDENNHIQQLVQLWVAEKTVDEGIEVPEAGINDNISTALENARTNLNI